MFVNRHNGRLFLRFCWQQSTDLVRPGLLLAILCGVAMSIFAGSNLPNPLHSTNRHIEHLQHRRWVESVQSFLPEPGTNGRTCGTCHVSSNAWSVTPPDIQARFNSSNGLDPIFRPVDGSNCPSDDVSTFQARQSAYSLLLNKRFNLNLTDQQKSDLAAFLQTL